MKKFFLLLPLFLVCFSFFHKAAFASTLFEDHFDSSTVSNGVALQWHPIHGPNQWQVNNSRYGGLIEFPSTIMDSVAGNIMVPNYQIDLDITPIQGEDKNIDFRWINNNNRYEAHFNNNGVFLFGQHVNYFLNNNTTYHVKIILNNQHIQFYVNSDKLFDFVDTSYQFSGSEQVGLRIGTGASFPTEVYFDNIVVKTLDTPADLDVPYFSQNALPWGPMEYDHAASIGIQQPTMDRWGCAVTSAAMVLNYHGMLRLPDGSTLDPGSLNTWLNNNDGYLTGVDEKNVPYSYLIWPSISKLTKQIVDNGFASYKLEHQLIVSNSSTNAQLDQDLTVDKFPDILQVTSASTSSHFVVAKGKGASTYDVNDPEWNVADLTSFGNTYTELNRFVPAQSDLSYIVAVVNPNTQLLITDPQGRKTGNEWVNGQLTTYNQIPGANYLFEKPISNPLPDGTNQNLGSGANAFLLPKPLEGNYQIQASSNKADEYTVNITTFDASGNQTLKKFFDTGWAITENTYSFNFSKTATPTINQTITFASTDADIRKLITMGKIRNTTVAASLISLLNSAANSLNAGNKLLAGSYLTSFQGILNHEKNLTLTLDAYQILTADVQGLYITYAIPPKTPSPF